MNLIALATGFEGVGSIISIVSIVLNVAVVLWFVVGILLGLKRGILHSLLRLGTIVVSALLALAGSFALRNAVASLASGALDSLINGEGTAELFEASPTLSALISGLPGALAGPFVFLVLFLVLNAILYVVYKILKRITVFGKILLDKILFKKLKIDHLVGAGIGIVSALIMVCCVLIPFAGYVSFADSVVEEIASVEGLDEETQETVESLDSEIMAPLADNFSLKMSNAILGHMVFKPLSSFKIDGDKVVLENEVAYIFNTYSTVQPLIEVNFNFSEFGQEQADALRRFANDLDDSVLIPRIVGEIIPAAAAKWNDGDTFAGMSNPVANTSEAMKPLMQDLIGILETTTHETLQDDLVTVADLVATLAEAGTLSLFNDNMSAQELIEALSEPGLVAGLIDTIYANPHMQVLVADFSNLGFNAIGGSLHIPEDDQAVRTQLADELNREIVKATAQDGYDAQVKTLSRGIQNVFDSYGVDTDSKEATLYAQCIIGIGPISADNDSAVIETYFSIIHASLEKASEETLSTGTIRPLGTALANDKALEAIRAYKAANGQDTLPTLMGVSNQLSGQEPLSHAIITMEKILITNNEIMNLSQEAFHKQSQALEDIIVLLAGALNEDESGKLSVDIKKLDTTALASTLRDMGEVRKDENGNEIHNLANGMTNLVKCFVQTTGINANAANNLVDHIATQKPNENGEQKDSLSTALVVVDIIGKQDTTKEEMKESVNTLVKDLDKESAEVLSDCISSNLINKYSSSDLGDERTDALVSVTKEMLNNFGEHTEDLSEEQLEAETTYMQTIFDLATSAGDDKSAPLFSSEENEESSLGKTATEFVDTIKHSTIISETFIEEKDNLQVAINDKMPENDKAQLQEAIAADTELSDELKDALFTAFNLGTFGQIGQ